MGCQASSQSLRQEVKDELYPGGTRDIPKLEGSIEKSALCARIRRSKERSLDASQFSSNSTTSTADSDPCGPVSSNTSHVSDVPSMKAEGTKGNTLDGSIEKSALWARIRRSKERSLDASQFSSNSTTSTTDSDPCGPVSSNTSHVSDVPSAKAEGTKGNKLEEPHAEPQSTRLEIGLKPQNDQENFKLETPTRMNMKSFVRMAMSASYAEAADGVIASDIVACEEPSAIIIPNLQTRTYHR